MTMAREFRQRQSQDRLVLGVKRHMDAVQSIQEFTSLAGHKNHELCLPRRP